MDKLEYLQKDELIGLIHQRNAVISHQTICLVNKTSQIRHFRIRLKKIRNSLDYLLIHPFSNDISYRTSKHKRDGHGRISKTK